MFCIANLGLKGSASSPARKFCSRHMLRESSLKLTTGTRHSKTQQRYRFLSPRLPRNHSSTTEDEEAHPASRTVASLTVPCWTSGRASTTAFLSAEKHLAAPVRPSRAYFLQPSASTCANEQLGASLQAANVALRHVNRMKIWALIPQPQEV